MQQEDRKPIDRTGEIIVVSYVEQHKMIEELKDHAHRIKGRDDFDMLLKRDKDDETIDSLSFKRLQQLY